jgi:cytochrome c
VLRQNRSRIIRTILAALMLFVAGSTLFGPARVQAQTNGKALFERRCGGCHALDRNKEGPRLGGVYGRTSGSVNAFQYSDSLKKAKIVWKEETLDRWLTDTERLVPNNDMTFHVEKADERSDIIAYLKQTSGM